MRSLLITSLLLVGCRAAAPSTSAPAMALANAPAVVPGLIGRAPAGTRVLAILDATFEDIRPLVTELMTGAGCPVPAGPRHLEVAGTDAGGWLAEMTGGIAIADIACALGVPVGPDGALHVRGVVIEPIADGVRLALGDPADLVPGAPPLAAQFPSERDAALIAIADLGPRDAPVLASLRIRDQRGVLRLRFTDERTAITAQAGIAAVIAQIATAGGAIAAPVRDRTEVRLELGALDELVRGELQASVLEAFRTPSSSMVPTLAIGDNVLALKGALIGTIGRGDVVVIEHTGLRMIKRVVGLPGDVVEIVDGQLVLNGTVVATTPVGPRTYDDDDVPDGTPVARDITVAIEHGVGVDHEIAIIDADNRQRDAGPWTIAPGELFVLADNRESASDSRTWGPIPASAVIGRAVVIWYSLAGDRFRYDRALLPIR